MTLKARITTNTLFLAMSTLMLTHALLQTSVMLGAALWGFNVGFALKSLIANGEEWLDKRSQRI